MMYCKKYIVSRLILLVGTFFWACSSENVSGGNEALDGMINGVSQKGPFLEGSSVTMQELDENSFAQTGKSFKGKVVNDRGDFSIENVALDHPYVLLEVNGYYRNEVTGKKSNGSIFMKALADVSKQPKVNINLLTHLEYERVQTLMEQNNMSIEEAKRQADREIFAAFYADVDYDKVEYLNIFGNSEGDAALLAINVLLLGEESDASFMERFALMGQDFAADGVWNDSSLKMKIADFACKANRSGKLAEIRKNIESWKIANVPAFETYVNRFWTNQYGLGKCDASNLGMRKLLIDDSRSSAFQDSAFKCSENGWIPYSSNEVYSKSVDVECTAKNEGEVNVVWEGNAKYGGYTYSRCEKGLWVRGGISLTCDTAGVAVGDLCHKTGTVNAFRASMPDFKIPEYVFVYAGDGVWEECDGLTKITRGCSAENVGDKEKIVYGHDDNTLSMYYKCYDNGWTKVDESSFYCSDSVSVSGDSVSRDSASGTCSIEVNGKMVYYLYVNRIIDVNGWPANGGWVKASYDPELGFCPEIFGISTVPCGESSEYICEVKYNQPKLRESGWVNYYCENGRWGQSNLVPNQYTDSRKEGLTDEAYDVLDLPKDAKIGERAGGLLEDCWYNRDLRTINISTDVYDYQVYDYCLSRNFYRYRENGSWTLETKEEFNNILYNSPECTAEREGEKSFIPRHDGEPDAIYQCISGYDEPVEYIFNRYEKK